MRYKYLFITAIFYFFTLLQNSFFGHLSLWGGTPNLVLIFFTLLIFFTAPGEPVFSPEVIFYALVAGLLLDIFASQNILGASAAILILISFLIKKLQQLLFVRSEEFLLMHFLVLFFVLLAGYTLALDVLLYFLKLIPALAGFSLKLAGALIYNTFFGLVFFLVSKRFFIGRLNNRQLSLFKK